MLKSKKLTYKLVPNTHNYVFKKWDHVTFNVLDYSPFYMTYKYSRQILFYQPKHPKKKTHMSGKRIIKKQEKII